MKPPSPNSIPAGEETFFAIHPTPDRWLSMHNGIVAWIVKPLTQTPKYTATGANVGVIEHRQHVSVCGTMRMSYSVARCQNSGIIFSTPFRRPRCYRAFGQVGCLIAGLFDCCINCDLSCPNTAGASYRGGCDNGGVGVGNGDDPLSVCGH